MTTTLDQPAEQAVQGQDSGAAPDRQVRLRIDDREMKTTYANAFRSNASHDELMLDFGINTVVGGASGNASGGKGEVRFEVSNRVIMNYYTAKRLAILLGNVVREHEERFGEVRLNIADRIKALEAGH